MMTNAIHIENLNFSYQEKHVLNNIDVTFKKNRFSVLLGVNGSGKSTLFKIIAGLLTKYTGKVELCDTDMRELKFKHRSTLMGFMAQHTTFAFPYTVSEVLLTGRAAFSGLKPRQKERELADEILRELSIFELRDKTVNRISGGELQIVMFARLLMQNPKILLLDEPTNHLDVYYQHYLMRKLKEYSQKGFTVVAIMHNPTLAFQYADDFYYLHEGTIVNGKTTSEPDVELLEKIYNTKFISIDKAEKQFILPISAGCEQSV